MASLCPICCAIPVSSLCRVPPRPETLCSTLSWESSRFLPSSMEDDQLQGNVGDCGYGRGNLGPNCFLESPPHSSYFSTRPPDLTHRSPITEITEGPGAASFFVLGWVCYINQVCAQPFPGCFSGLSQACQILLPLWLSSCGCGLPSCFLDIVGCCFFFFSIPLPEKF